MLSPHTLRLIAATAQPPPVAPPTGARRSTRKRAGGVASAFVDGAMSALRSLSTPPRVGLNLFNASAATPRASRAMIGIEAETPVVQQPTPSRTRARSACRTRCVSKAVDEILSAPLEPELEHAPSFTPTLFSILFIVFVALAAALLSYFPLRTAASTTAPALHDIDIRVVSSTSAQFVVNHTAWSQNSMNATALVSQITTMTPHVSTLAGNVTGDVSTSSMKTIRTVTPSPAPAAASPVLSSPQRVTSPAPATSQRASPPSLQRATPITQQRMTSSPTSKPLIVTISPAEAQARSAAAAEAAAADVRAAAAAAASARARRAAERDLARARRTAAARSGGEVRKSGVGSASRGGVAPAPASSTAPLSPPPLLQSEPVARTPQTERAPASTAKGRMSASVVAPAAATPSSTPAPAWAPPLTEAFIEGGTSTAVGSATSASASTRSRPFLATAEQAAEAGEDTRLVSVDFGSIALHATHSRLCVSVSNSRGGATLASRCLSASATARLGAAIASSTNMPPAFALHGLPDDDVRVTATLMQADGRLLRATFFVHAAPRDDAGGAGSAVSVTALW